MRRDSSLRQVVCTLLWQQHTTAQASRSGQLEPALAELLLDKRLAPGGGILDASLGAGRQALGAGRQLVHSLCQHEQLQRGNRKDLMKND